MLNFFASGLQHSHAYKWKSLEGFVLDFGEWLWGFVLIQPRGYKCIHVPMLDEEASRAVGIPSFFHSLCAQGIVLLEQMANEARPCPCDIGDRMEYGSLGEEVQIEHVKAYVVKPKAPTDKAVIVIQDIFGWQLPNTRYMADMLASNGYVAVCPDFFLGKEPWCPSSDWSTFQDWLEDKKPTNINKEVDVVLKYLKEQRGAKRIGVVGFCWGGVATHYIALQYPEVKAGVSVYGIIRAREDCYELKSPTLFIFGENDTVIPLDQVTTLEEKLKDECTVDFKVKVFPNQSHGFVHRKREDVNPSDKPYIQEAREDMINWLNKYM